MSQDNTSWEQQDSFLAGQIEKTVGQIRRVEWFAMGAQLATLALAGILIGIIFDHWVFPGGLSVKARLVFALSLVLVLVVTLVRRIIPLLVKRVNPLFAASVLEGGQSNKKNFIINWFLLRNRSHANSTELNRAVLQGVVQQANEEVRELPDESPVDHSAIIRWGIVFTCLVAILAVYSIASPKNPLTSIERLFFPTAKIQAPLSVRFLDIKPGDVSVFSGDTITIEAEIAGVGKKPVFFSWTTDDRRLVDRTLPMEFVSGNMYKLLFPKGLEGLTEPISYRILVGLPGKSDNYSPSYRAAIRQPMTIAVERLKISLPEYTKRAPVIVENSGEIRALWGSTVEVVAKANAPLKSAFFLPRQKEDNARTMALDPSDPLRARLTFVPQKENDVPSQEPTFSPHDTWSILCHDQEENANRSPAVYSIEMYEDLPPNVAWESTPEGQPKIPLNSSFSVKVRVEDPDFGLTAVTLAVAPRLQQDNRQAAMLIRDQVTQNIELLDPNSELPITGEHVLTGTIRPSELKLTPGLEYEYRVIARDGKTPQPNKTSSPVKSFTVTEPSNQPGEPESQPDQKKDDKKEESGQKDDKSDSDQGQEKSSEGQSKEDDSLQSGQSEDGKQKDDKSDSGQDQDKSSQDKSSEGQSKEDDSSQSGQSEDGKQKDDKSDSGQGQEKSSQDKSSEGQSKEDDSSQSGQSEGGKQKDDKSDSGQGQEKSSQDKSSEGQSKEDDSSQSGQSEDGKQGQNGKQSEGGKQDNSGNQGNSTTGEKSEKQEQGDSQGDNGKSSNSGKSGNDSPEGMNPDSSSSGGQAQKPEPKPDQAPSSGSDTTDSKQDKQNNQDKTGNTSKENNADSQGSQGKNKSQSKSDSTPIDPDANPGDAFERILDHMEQTGKSTTGREEEQKNTGQELESPPGGGEAKPNDSKGKEVKGPAPEELSQGLERRQGDVSPDSKDLMTKQAKGKLPEEERKVSPDSRVVDDPDNPVQGEQADGPTDSMPTVKSKNPQNFGKNSELVDPADTQKGQGGSSSNKQTMDANELGINSDQMRDGTHNSDSSAQSPSKDGTKDEQKKQAKQEKQEGNSGQKTEPDQKKPGTPPGAGASDATTGDKANDSAPNQSLPGGANSSQSPQGNSDAPQIGGGHASSSSSQADSGTSLADDPNIKYTEQATNLVLEYLEDQVKDNVDPVLLQKLGWTEDQLKQFLKKWKSMKENAKKTEATQDDRVSYLESLRNIGLRRGEKFQTQTGGTLSDKEQRSNAEDTRFAPPPAFKDRFRAFSRGVSKEQNR